MGVRYYYVKSRDEYAHPAVVFLLAPDGRITRYLYGVRFSPRDLRLGLLEASQGKIGSTLDRIILYCYHYDPTTGRYSATTMNMVRVLGGLTVLLLGGSIAVMLWRERRQPQRRQRPA